VDVFHFASNFLNEHNIPEGQRHFIKLIGKIGVDYIYNTLMDSIGYCHFR